MLERIAFFVYIDKCIFLLIFIIKQSWRLFLSAFEYVHSHD